MCRDDKSLVQQVRVVVADLQKSDELQKRREADADRKMPQVTCGAEAASRWGECCFEILSDGETAGYIVERKWPVLEVYRLFIFSEFRCRGIAKEAVLSWRSLRLMNGFEHVQLEVDDESAGFWFSVFPWYPFDYSGVHPHVPLKSPCENFGSPFEGTDTVPSNPSEGTK